MKLEDVVMCYEVTANAHLTWGNTGIMTSVENERNSKRSHLVHTNQSEVGPPNDNLRYTTVRQL
jgi:hypothetical protein